MIKKIDKDFLDWLALQCKDGKEVSYCDKKNEYKLLFNSTHVFKREDMLKLAESNGYLFYEDDNLVGFLGMSKSSGNK